MFGVLKKSRSRPGVGKERGWHKVQEFGHQGSGGMETRAEKVVRGTEAQRLIA